MSGRDSYGKQTKIYRRINISFVTLRMCFFCAKIAPLIDFYMKG